jgi:hypothetical protein
MATQLGLGSSRGGVTPPPQDLQLIEHRITEQLTKRLSNYVFKGLNELSDLTEQIITQKKFQVRGFPWTTDDSAGSQVASCGGSGRFVAFIKARLFLKLLESILYVHTLSVYEQR